MGCILLLFYPRKIILLKIFMIHFHDTLLFQGYKSQPGINWSSDDYTTVFIFKVGSGAACNNPIESDNASDIDIFVCIDFPSLALIYAGAAKVK